LNNQDKFREVLWQLIEKHYNVNRKDPTLLIAKNPLMGNPIDRLSDDLLVIFNDLLNQVISEMQPPSSSKPEEDGFQEDLTNVSTNAPTNTSSPSLYDQDDGFFWYADSFDEGSGDET
jgi:hypothetical protein